MNNNLYFDGATTIKLNYVTKIHGEQDGAMYGGYLFRFDGSGLFSVIDLSDYSLVDSFFIDGIEILKPHGNSVCFGSEFYSSDDEFPLLYSNVYNSYHNDKLGYCLVYRVTREGKKFSTKLVQVIKIGFTNDSELWCSKDCEDVRPYGNFAIDVKDNLLYAFTMRDQDKSTRFFEFKLPSLSDGEFNEEYGVNVVTLEKDDILSSFKTPYIDYMQGAICYNGYIYSVEGFNAVNAQKPKFKVIDVKKQKQVMDINLADIGVMFEMEFVEVYNDVLYLSDCWGNTNTVSFGVLSEKTSANEV